MKQKGLIFFLKWETVRNRNPWTTLNIRKLLKFNLNQAIHFNKTLKMGFKKKENQGEKSRN